MNERRRYERFPARFLLDISPGPKKNDPKRALTKDVSRGGARFLTDQPMAVGENVSLRIVSDQDEEKTFEAKVVREEGVDENGSLRYEIAVQFESVLPEIVIAHLKNESSQSEEEEGEQPEREQPERAEEDRALGGPEEAKLR